MYERIGRPAAEAADRIREALKQKGYELAFGSPTNQVFILMSPEDAGTLSEKVEMSFMEQRDDGRVLMRIATSWATAPEDTERLIACL